MTESRTKDNKDDPRAMVQLIAEASQGPRSKSRRRLLVVLCKCVRLALKPLTGDKKPLLRVVRLTERWARKDPKVSIANLSAAADRVSGGYRNYAGEGVACAAYVGISHYPFDAASAAWDAIEFLAQARQDAATDSIQEAIDEAGPYGYALYDRKARSARAKLFKQCAEILRKEYRTLPKPRRTPD